MSEQLSAEERARFLWKLWDESPALQGRDEWVGHIATSIKDAEKQAQAEVLAACRKRLKQAARSVKDVQLMRKYTDAQMELVTTLLNDLANNVFMNLQPVASDLEALLREERDGTEARLLCANAECPKRHLRIEWSEEGKICLGCLRDALNYQLGFKEGKEKARAEGKG